MLVEGLLFCIGSPLTADYRRLDTLLYKNEHCPIYASMTSDTGKDTYAPNIMPSRSSDLAISESSKKSVDNFAKLQESFNQNIEDKEAIASNFKRIANQLCQIEVKEALVQYNSYDEALDIQILLKDGVVLSLSQFVGESEELVDFTISNNNKVLVCGEMPIQELVNKIKELTNV